MKGNEKRNILILIIVGIIIIFAIAKYNGKTVKADEMEQTDEIVSELPSGTKLNVSEKLAEKKYFANYEISNIQLVQKEGKTQLYADVKNIGNETADLTNVVITFLDQDGNPIARIEDALIAQVEPGKITKLNVNSTSETAINAYDFSIKLAE